MNWDKIQENFEAYYEGTAACQKTYIIKTNPALIQLVRQAVEKDVEEDMIISYFDSELFPSDQVKWEDFKEFLNGYQSDGFLVFWFKKALQVHSQSAKEFHEKYESFKKIKNCDIFNDLHFKVNVAKQQEYKTKLGVNLSLGNSCQQLSQQLQSGLNIAENCVSVVFELQCNNAKQTQQQLEEIIENIIELVTSLCPVEVLNNLIKSFKFAYNVIDDSNLQFAIYLDHELIPEIVSIISDLMNLYIVEGSVQFQFGTSVDFKQILDIKKQNILEYLSKQNEHFCSTLDLKINSSALSLIKAIFKESVKEQDQNIRQQAINQQLLLLLFRSSSFEVDLSINQLCECLLNIAKEKIFLNQLIEFTKQQGPSTIIESIPLANEVIQFAQSNLKTQFKLHIMIPKIHVQVDFETQGFSKIFDEIMK